MEMKDTRLDEKYIDKCGIEKRLGLYKSEWVKISTVGLKRRTILTLLMQLAKTEFEPKACQI